MLFVFLASSTSIISTYIITRGTIHSLYTFLTLSIHNLSIARRSRTKKQMMAIRSPAPEEEGMHGSKKAPSSSTSSSTSMRRSKTEFPVKLYAMLELADNIPVFSRAVTWLPHGRAFRVLDEDTFMEEVVPVFFNQTKIRSFNRQLHLWGFRR